MDAILILTAFDFMGNTVHSANTHKWKRAVVVATDIKMGAK